LAGSSVYTAVLDACVLYPAPVRDLLLSLAVEGLFHARWSSRIQDEWVSNLLANRTDLTREGLAQTVDAMNQGIPDCLVVGWEALEPSVSLPDAGDNHVLAAAIRGHADTIVTFNLKDFPSDYLATFDIEAHHPDDFVLNQIELAEIPAIRAVKKMRARLKNPPKSAEELLERLRQCNLPLSADRLRHAIDLI